MVDVVPSLYRAQNDLNYLVPASGQTKVMLNNEI
jgi:hypothetical protein